MTIYCQYCQGDRGDHTTVAQVRWCAEAIGAIRQDYHRWEHV